MNEEVLKQVLSKEQLERLKESLSVRIEQNQQGISKLKKEIHHFRKQIKKIEKQL